MTRTGAEERDNAVLERLRGELDGIDAVLLDTVQDRMACCVRIAELKREHGIPMMQPARIGLAQQRAADYAEAHGLSADFLRRLYDLLIAEACRLEDEVIGGQLSTESARGTANHAHAANR